MSNVLRINALIDYWNAEEDGAVLIECGKRIIKRRKDPDKRAGKLTQEQLSEQLDLTRKTVGNWEAGHTHIETVGQLAALSEILECDIEYLTCQCDTLRKENQNAVELYGLSEEAFIALQNMDFWTRSMVSSLLQNKYLLQSILDLWYSAHEDKLKTLYGIRNDRDMDPWYSGEMIKQKEYELYRSLADFIEK